MKRILVTLMAVVLTASYAALPAHAEWKQDSSTENRYYSIDGEICKNGLFFIEGVMYSFDKDGVCLGPYSGWTRLKSDKTKYKYYYDDGTPANEWCFIDGFYYYFDNLIYSGEKYPSIRRITNPVVTESNEQITISFILENLTDRYVPHGHLFELEQLVDGEWVRLNCNENFSCHDEVVGEPPKSRRELSIDVKAQYGSIESGTYRIVYGKINADYSDSFAI